MTLAELIEAYKSGATRKGLNLSPLWLDNDNTSAEWHDDEWENVGDAFSMDPRDLLEQLLTLVGIPFEHV